MGGRGGRGRPPGNGGLGKFEMSLSFIEQKKNSEKKFSFFFIEQIVNQCNFLVLNTAMSGWTFGQAS
jgi:hypothetical protein